MSHTVDQPLEQTAQYRSALWHSAENEQFSAALWRLPKQTEQQLIIDLSGQLQRVKVDLDELMPGFVFSPFLNASGKEGIFLHADLYARFKPSGELVEPLPGSSHSAWEAFLNKVGHYQPSAPLRKSFLALKGQTNGRQATEDEKHRYIQLVQRGKEAIQRGELLKIALSRSREVSLPADFDALQMFDRLCRIYPNAFVSFVSIPGVGRWMGASPETLISMDRKGVFRTVALAGTQVLQPDSSEKDARWTHKEIEEQALVSRYIVNCFKNIRLREYEEVGPKTVIAGNLMHLRTDFTVDTQAVNFPQLGTVMLELLHPTSAVCGMPRAAALEFITQNEAYDRRFYSGFLGPVNIDQETSLYVNLRCMHLGEQTARLYAGAGITAESNPEKEWLETEMKYQTMLNAF